MTKQEAIRQAWGNHWQHVKDYTNKSGWCIDRGHRLFSTHGIYDNDPDFDFDVEGDWDDAIVLEYRPKSLRGIEDNNGWIKIESEKDLPKETGLYHVYFKGFNSSEIAYYHYQTHAHTWLEKIAHYRPIIKPQPPIY